jgi:hypothetical protein
MSTSPAVSSSSDSPLKRRRASGGDMAEGAFVQDNNNAPMQLQQPQVPKRGARACTSCRKGKNRCEGEVRSMWFVCPPPYHLLSISLRVADVNSAERHVCSKNQRKRIHRLYLALASSKSSDKLQPYISINSTYPRKTTIPP